MYTMQKQYSIRCIEIILVIFLIFFASCKTNQSYIIFKCKLNQTLHVKIVNTDNGLYTHMKCIEKMKLKKKN
jgi:hypothetical protein